MIAPEVPPGEVYGVGQHAECLSGALHGAGVPVSVVVPGPADCSGHGGRLSGLVGRVQAVDFGPLDWTASVLQLNLGLLAAGIEQLEHCRRQSPLTTWVIHGQGILAAWATVLIGRTGKAPTVLTLHTAEALRAGPLGAGGYFSRLEAFAMAEVDQTLVVSESLRMQLSGGNPEVASRLRVVYPGVRSAEGLGNVARLDDRFAGPIVVFAGRLAPEKGPLDALRAFACMRARTGTGSLVVIGTGKLGEVMTAAAQALGVAGHVHLLGYLPQAEVFTWLERASALVVSSTYETLSLVSIEALLAGCPVCAYRTGGIPEVLADAPGAWLVEPGQWQQLADALCMAVKSTDPRVSERARAYAREKFGETRMVSDTVAVYQDIIKE